METLHAAIHLPEDTRTTAGVFPTHVSRTAATGVPVGVGPVLIVKPILAATRLELTGVAAVAPRVALDGGMTRIKLTRRRSCFAASQRHKGLRAVRAYSLFTGEYVHPLSLAFPTLVPVRTIPPCPPLEFCHNLPTISEAIRLSDSCILYRSILWCPL